MRWETDLQANHSRVTPSVQEEQVAFGSRASNPGKWISRVILQLKKRHLFLLSHGPIVPAVVFEDNHRCRMCIGICVSRLGDIQYSGSTFVIKQLKMEQLLQFFEHPLNFQPFHRISHKMDAQRGLYSFCSVTPCVRSSHGGNCWERKLAGDVIKVELLATGQLEE